jgi:hypothetical protein
VSCQAWPICQHHTFQCRIFAQHYHRQTKSLQISLVCPNVYISRQVTVTRIVDQVDFFPDPRPLHILYRYGTNFLTSIRSEKHKPRSDQKGPDPQHYITSYTGTKISLLYQVISHMSVRPLLNNCLVALYRKLNSDRKCHN